MSQEFGLPLLFGGPGDISAVEELAAEPDEGTHGDVQDAQPELGTGDAPTPKSKRVLKKGETPKVADKAAGKVPKTAKKAKAKGPKAPKAKRAAKPKAEPKVWKPGMRGVRRDGQPRKRPGTNEPRSPEAAKMGARIAKLRVEKGLSQYELAAKAGISQPGLANIERGVASAGPKTFPGLAKVLGIPLSDAPKVTRGRTPKDPAANAARKAKKAAGKIGKAGKGPKAAGKPAKAKKGGPAKKTAKKTKKGRK